LTSEDEGTVTVQNIRNYAPNNSASHPRGMEFQWFQQLGLISVKSLEG